MYPFPGKALYHIIKYLRRYKEYITPAFIYILGWGMNISKFFNTPKNWIENFEENNKVAKKQTSDYFIHPVWKDLTKILNTIFDAALEYRKEQPTFFLDIATGGRLYHNAALHKAMEKLGCLSIKTSGNDIYSILPTRCNGMSIDADWFVSLHQLYKILFSNDAIIQTSAGKGLQKECELREWCHRCFTKKGERDITTDSCNCKYSPWNNVSSQDLKQCSFGRL